MNRLLPHHLIFALLFALLVATDIYLGSTSYAAFRIISKPLILISLILYFLHYKKGIKNSISKHIFIALVFSFIGDIFLLFDHLSVLYFILGLGSFLGAHVFYTFGFYQQGATKIKFDFWFAAIFLSIYGVALYSSLYANLGSIKIPVAVYVLVILLMAIMAYKRKGNVSDSSFLFVFIGALSFILSDSVLAINKFLTPLPYTNFLVMGSYATAQYLIIRGLLKSADVNTD